MELDLKTAEYNDKNDNDYYDDDDIYVEDNYYYSNKNIKHDLGATQFKKVPLYKVTLDTKIPDEPQEKHDKPNESHYEKERKAILNEIEQHKKNKEELYERKKQERIGHNPELKKCFEDVTKINNELEPLDLIIADISKKIKEPLAKEKSLKIDRDRLEKEIDYKSLEKANFEIEQMQEKLGFGTLTASEEKKLMDKKSKLESQIPKITQYQKIRDQIKVLRDANEADFVKLKSHRDVKNDLIKKKRTIQEKIDLHKGSMLENKTEIQILDNQIESVRQAIRELHRKLNSNERDFNEKWYKYEKYMEIVTYIREAKKKQSDIIKREEKLKKKAEKDAKKEGKAGASGEVEINIVKTGESEESKSCKVLISYFKALSGKDEPKKQEEIKNANSISDKLNEDLKSGAIEFFDKQNILNDQVVGIESGKSKKKEKGPKVSKRDQKELKSDLLVLGVDICSQISSLGLNPPQKKVHIDAFIKTLETKLEELKNVTPVQAKPPVVKEAVNSKEVKDVKEEKTNEVKEIKEAKDEVKEAKEVKEVKEVKEISENKEVKKGVDEANTKQKKKEPKKEKVVKEKDIENEKEKDKDKDNEKVKESEKEQK